MVVAVTMVSIVLFFLASSVAILLLLEEEVAIAEQLLPAEVSVVS